MICLFSIIWNIDTPIQLTTVNYLVLKYHFMATNLTA